MIKFFILSVLITINCKACCFNVSSVIELFKAPIKSIFGKNLYKKKADYEYYNVSIIPHAFSIDVFAITNISVPLNCSGIVEEKITNQTIFECESNIYCSKCENFTVSNLLPNTFYKFNINGNISNVQIMNEVKTEEYYGSYNISLIPDTYSIDVSVFTNITLALNCSGTVIQKSTNQTIFECKNNKNCVKCENFTICNLTPKTDYIIDIKGNLPIVEIKGEVSTVEKYSGSFNFSFHPHSYSIDVLTATSMVSPLSCFGAVKNSLTSKIIFDCNKNTYCKICKSFTVPNLIPNTKYEFRIRGTTCKIKIMGDVKTEPFYGSYNISFVPHTYSIDVFAVTNITLHLNCFGNVTDKRNRKTIFECKKDLNCSKCANFTISNLNPNSLYKFDIKGNVKNVQIVGDVKTEPLYVFYKVSFSIHQYSIEVIAITNITLPLNCSGRVKDIIKNQTVFECQSNKYCSQCKNFTISNLKPKTLYKFEIKGNDTNVYINNTVKTESPPIKFRFSFLSDANRILVLIKTNIISPINCMGIVKPTNGSTPVFNCSSNTFCRQCKSFPVLNLIPNTYYSFSIYGNLPEVYINGTYKTQPITDLSKYNIGIIIGLCLGAFVGFVIIAVHIYIIKKYKKKLEDETYSFTLH